MTVAGVEVFPLWPPLIAFTVAFACSLAGVTGAFLLLPIQMSLFGFTSPSVSATNHLYNIPAASAGAFRYFREGRMLKPLALVLILGTVPGIIGGVFIRIHLLPDTVAFKLFVGLVLLVLGIQLTIQTLREKVLKASISEIRPAQVKVTAFNASRLDYTFLDQPHTLEVIPALIFSFVVGLIGGAYGIGGGVFTSVYLIGICRLPVHTTAGATMLATLVSSIAGVIGYTLVSAFQATGSTAIAPDWAFGILLGIGGLFGTYYGAKAQKHIPSRAIKLLLAALLLFIAVSYVWGFMQR